MNSINQHKGFVVLTTTVLLSIVSIAFTAQMASTQLLDNKIVANYYRNNEAFVNAESGLHLLLSRLDDPILGPDIFNSATYNASTTYTDSSTDNHYSVQLIWLNANTLKLVSTGTSMDDSAQRIISLQIKPEMGFNLPESAVSFNGKLNLDESAMVNNGCEGVSAANCKSPGNFAGYQLVSHPNNRTAINLCTGSVNKDAFYEQLTADNSLQVGSRDTEGNVIKWPNKIPSDSDFFGVPAGDSAPHSLFESTFGVSQHEGVAALLAASEVAKIVGGAGCSSRLKELEESSPEIDTIYITGGDCKINANDVTPGDKYFAIGTVENPKMVFIEGGTFTSRSNRVASVSGMLYFLPDTTTVGTEAEDYSVDMGGVSVNGTLLSEYSCSYDETENNTKQPFSVRYDKQILDKLYGSVGRNRLTYKGYSLVQGSWRDF
jgi:hypothetical protein